MADIAHARVVAGRIVFVGSMMKVQQDGYAVNAVARTSRAEEALGLIC